VLLLVAVMLAAITVPIFGGRLLALADLRFNRAWLILAAIGVQIAIVSVLPSGTPAVHVVAHICSYVLAGWFLAANTQIAGLWIIVLGGALNFIAIVANGGVMPADPDAFATAGLITQPGEFANSTSLPDPQLTFLGDIFAVPKSWPLHNVYSIGDVLIAVGACVLIHRACGSRLIPATRGDLSSLRQHRGFMRLWVAQGISNIGDWVYALAVVTSLVERHVGGNTLGLLIVLQVGPAALAGFIGGPFIDRFPRKALMIGADVLRAAAVGSLLLAGTPSLGHLYVVAACVGIGSAVFQPSLQASLPNLVPPSKLVAANAALGATYHLAVMIGPVLGGLLAAGLGPSPAFLINGASFAVSAVLIATAVVPRRAPSAEPHAPALTALMDGARFIRSSVLARGVLIVTGMVIFAATLRTPLEPLFVLRTLHAGPQALGLTGGIWGVGMVFGSIAAASIARRASRARVLSSSIAVVGVCILIASQAHSLSTVLCLWLIGGIGNALGTVSYESLLQEHTPDAFRGRVLAASEAVLHSAFLFGALLAGTVSGVIGCGRRGRRCRPARGRGCRPTVRRPSSPRSASTEPASRQDQHEQARTQVDGEHPEVVRAAPVVPVGLRPGGVDQKELDRPPADQVHPDHQQQEASDPTQKPVPTGLDPPRGDHELHRRERDDDGGRRAASPPVVIRTLSS